MLKQLSAWLCCLLLESAMLLQPVAAQRPNQGQAAYQPSPDNLKARQ